MSTPANFKPMPSKDWDGRLFSNVEAICRGLDILGEIERAGVMKKRIDYIIQALDGKRWVDWNQFRSQKQGLLNLKAMPIKGTWRLVKRTTTDEVVNNQP